MMLADIFIEFVYFTLRIIYNVVKYTYICIYKTVKYVRSKKKKKFDFDDFKNLEITKDKNGNYIIEFKGGLKNEITRK